jgi:allophanate hydrolase subunit 2
VRYLAVHGGIAVPERLGACATLIAARLGGFEGRPLRRGDPIPVGGAHVSAGAAIPPILREERAPIAIDPGPHAHRFPPDAMDALLATAWRISRWGDRVGVRLEGGRVPREGPDLALPAPMLRGAVQVTTDGTPIVLGPDHPVTGGYPVLAVVRRTDLPRLARRRVGEEVRFQLGR